ncbi:hypothetical protein RCL_jg22802.t1 [Rhizophagus clarus]|uniref:Uncharacterized protein n=1 Tax=Rhizophagus clarus TaxID=94130 RepID=A0A8H3LEN0_9GLOM|nr:hypothetical protein RCL_jg22802.t1 [Rhizophagus clarus]
MENKTFSQIFDRKEIQSNHRSCSIKKLKNDKMPKGRHARWIMDLQQLKFEENINRQEIDPRNKKELKTLNKKNNKIKYVKINKWHNAKYMKGQEYEELKDNEAILLLKLGKVTERNLLKKLN